MLLGILFTIYIFSSIVAQIVPVYQNNKLSFEAYMKKLLCRYLPPFCKACIKKTTILFIPKQLKQYIHSICAESANAFGWQLSNFRYKKHNLQQQKVVCFVIGPWLYRSKWGLLLYTGWYITKWAKPCEGELGPWQTIFSKNFLPNTSFSAIILKKNKYRRYWGMYYKYEW